MKRLRIAAMLLGGSLIIGEAYRSWGVGRTPTAWLDDMIMGPLLICAAIAAARSGWQRRALFTGSWGVCAGMLYGSFFGKVFDPANANPGNFSLGILTSLVGVAFAVSVLGFVASLTVADEMPPPDA
ncbi:MAG: hypothetical protein ACRCUI_02920 [Polymorphobacter sp.]